MTFHILTIFPKILDSYLNESILKRAEGKKLISIEKYDLRDWTHDKHRSVDDTPYGGGAGMLMKVEPIANAIHDITHNAQRTTISSSREVSKVADPPLLTKGRDACLPARQGVGSVSKSKVQSSKFKVVLLSAKGKTWTQAMAKRYSKLDEVIFVCGRYEGVDERVLKFIDEEISIGDYVLTGGELGAVVMIDSITRLLPGVLGNNDSAVDESHSTPGLLEYPHYTRPEVFEYEYPSTSSPRPELGTKAVRKRKMRVPKVLLSGNHAEIEKWRRAKSKLKKSRVKSA